MGTFPMALHLVLLQSKVISSQAPCTTRRCSSACRPTLVSAYMRTPGMNRCTVALSLLYQSLVGAPCVCLSPLQAAVTGQTGASCTKPCTCYMSPAANLSNIGSHLLPASQKTSLCCLPRSLNILKSFASSQCRRGGGTDRCPVQSGGLALLPAISGLLGLFGDGHPGWHSHLGAAAAAQEVANAGCQHHRVRTAYPCFLGMSC